MNRDLGIEAAPLFVEPPPEYAEKRRHPRRQLAVRCWIRHRAHTLFARVHDISLGGLSLRSPVPFSSNDELELTLLVPGSSSERSPIRLRGRVVWVRETLDGTDGSPRPSGPRIGARFDEVVDGADLLRALVAT